MPTISLPPDASRHRSQVIRELRAELKTVQQSLRAEQQRQVVSTGIPSVDALLPDQGLLQGGLSEWIATEPGGGNSTLAMRVAGQAQQTGPVLIVDARQQWYAASFAGTGVQLSQVILIRPQSRKEELWAMEQALRCPGIGAVLCRIDSLRTQEFRRLQLAAETGTAVGLLVRSAAAQRQAGWADVRLLVSPCPATRPFHRGLTVRCLYARGHLTDQTVHLEICDETGAVCLAAGLSDSTAQTSVTR